MKYDAFAISELGEALKHTVNRFHDGKYTEVVIISAQNEEYLDIHLHIRKLAPTFLEKLKNLIEEHEKNDI